MKILAEGEVLRVSSDLKCLQQIEKWLSYKIRDSLETLANNQVRSLSGSRCENANAVRVLLQVQPICVQLLGLRVESRGYG